MVSRDELRDRVQEKARSVAGTLGETKERAKRALKERRGGGDEEERIDQAEARRKRVKQEARREAAKEARQEYLDEYREEIKETAKEEQKQELQQEQEQSSPLRDLAQRVASAAEQMDDGQGQQGQQTQGGMPGLGGFDGDIDVEGDVNIETGPGGFGSGGEPTSLGEQMGIDPEKMGDGTFGGRDGTSTTIGDQMGIDPEKMGDGTLDLGGDDDDGGYML